MQQIRISIQASDPATVVELDNELEALRGHEPKGAELIEDPAPRPKTMEATIATTVLIALVAGMGGAMGKELADSVISWFIERMRAVAARRKSPLIVTLGNVSLTVDEHTVPDKAAAQLAAGLR